jgi:hypothetical protein
VALTACADPEKTEPVDSGIADTDTDTGEACSLPAALEDAVVQWLGDGDGFGAALAGADLTGDGVGDLLVGAYIFGSDYEGAVYVDEGPLSGVMDMKDATGTILGDQTEGAFGSTGSVWLLQ